MQNQVILEFPVALPKKWLQNKEALNRSKDVLVMELLRKGEISQGKAAELLEINRCELLNLMSKYDISMADFLPRELHRQREYVGKKEKKNK